MSDQPPDPPSIVETFAELAELTEGVDWDAFIAEREAERRMPEDLAEALALLRLIRDDRGPGRSIAVFDRVDALLARHPAPEDPR